MPKKKQIKLLIVSDTYYPHWTGISKSIYNLAGSMKEKFDITVLTVSHGKGLKSEETVDGVSVVRAAQLLTFSRSHYSLSVIFKFFSLVRKFDIILINSPCANILPFSLIAKLFGKKLLIFHQGDLILPTGFVNWVIEKIFDVSTFTAFALCDKAATYTDEYILSSRCLKPFAHKCTGLLLPVVLQSNPPGQKLYVKEKGQVLFGFGGRFVEEKGFDILFRAIPVIKKHLPGAKFLFAGPKRMEYEDFFSEILSLYEPVKNDIIFLGLLDDKKLPAFYKTIDFLIVPSRSDCFNMMQAEAMLSGAPCLSSNIPGLSFMVKKTGFGLLFEKNNAPDLAQKAVRAASRRQELQAKYPLVREVLDTDIIREKIKKFITE
jgi:glycosyltransferase involved in cell wall biosynthesis